MKKILLLVVLALLAPTVVHAWEPPKTVSVIVGTRPGAGAEIAFRILANIVQQDNPKTTFIIQHMPGADQVIAKNHLMMAPNNGTVIAAVSKMPFVTNDIWQKKSKRFEWDSFRPIASIGDSALVLVANKNSKITTPPQFVNRISNTTDKINVAIGGGAHRTTLEYLIYNAKADKNLVTHINYNGPAQALYSVLQNETEFGIMPIAIAQPQVEAGAIKIIGITGNTMLKKFPNAPLLNTIAPGINVSAGWLMIAPPKTPDEIVNWYNAAFVNAIDSKEFREWMDKNIITIDQEDLTPKGMEDKLSVLRKTFLPILEKVITEGESGK
jgi:tripartite-type tricarboxylate transporter receptor subunit TctC